MFGREPRLPLDLAFGVDLGERHGSVSSYTKALKNRLTEAYELARRSLKETRAKQKKDYDVRVRGATIESGDRVLVKILAFEGKHKLADRWEDEPYVVLQQPNPEIPVFVVQRESGEGQKRTLHRNVLLPIGSLSDFFSTDTPPPKDKSKQRQVLDQKDGTFVDDESEEEDDILLVQSNTTQSDASAVVDTNIRSTFADDDDTTAQTSGDDHESVVVDESSSDDDDHTSLKEVAGVESTVEDYVEGTTNTSDQLDVEECSDDDINENIPNSAVAQRRSTRRQEKPTWQTSGEFIMSQTTHEPDWMQKARYLEHLARQ